MKNLLKLGNTLSKVEQKAIVGGKRMCGPHCPCPPNETCVTANGSTSGFCSSLQI